MTRQLRGIAGLAILVLLAVGLPLALGATVGNPLHAWPSIKAGDMSDQDVIAIMAAVAYLAWGTFAFAVIVEVGEGLAARLGRRVQREFRIPLLGLQQDLARTLIATVLLLAPAIATVAGPAVSAFAGPVLASSPHNTPATNAPSPSSGSTASDRQQARNIDVPDTPVSTYIVPSGGGPATYWDLAATYLGDGTRWHTIWQLNKGRAQADGTMMTDPRLLRPGWTVLLPVATATPLEAEHPVRVEAGDTLSGLAAADAITNWETVWPSNAGRGEPNGERFTNPNLIKPGWTVVLPGRSAAPSHAGTPAPVPRPSSLPRPVPPVHSTPSDPTPHPTPTGASAGEPSSERTRPAASSPADAQHESSWAVRPPLVAFAGGGVLLAGVSLVALRQHRRRQFRYRRPGRAISSTPEPLAPMEKALLAAGNAAAADVTWLDQALRGLVHTLAAHEDAQLPDVVAVRMAEDVLELVLTEPHADPPDPWTVDETGTRWRLDRGDDLHFDPARVVYHFAPYPTLVSVGRTSGGEHWLLDLERIGALSLSGDPERCLNLARFLAAELAHNTWSEQLQVTLLGFGTELAGLNPERVCHADDPDKAMTTLHRHFQDIGSASRQVGVGVLDGRLRNIAGDVWMPKVLLAAPTTGFDPAAMDQLLEAMRARPGRSATALLLCDDANHTEKTRWQLHIDEHATLTIPTLGLELIAHQLPAGEAADLAALLTLAADTDDQPMPPARGAQPWDEYADAAGAARHAETLLHDGDATQRIAHADSELGGSVLPLPKSAYLEQGATTEEDIETLAPPVRGDTGRRVRDSDPDLDADLAAWWDPDDRTPKLTLLGGVSLRAHGTLPENRPRTSFYTEIIAYLATHPDGVTAERFATDLWPNDPDISNKTTPRQSVSVARGWLGKNPNSGQEYLPAAGDGTTTGVYRVNGVLVDAELFRRLRLRGTTSGADGIGDLVAALDLVIGPPLAQRRERGYGWLVDTPLDHEYTAMIVDAAHVVAIRFLGDGEPERASGAAQVALGAGARDDVPLLDLVAACDAQDKRAEADCYVQRIMDNHDAEVEEDLPPRTYDVLRRRRWGAEVT